MILHSRFDNPTAPELKNLLNNKESKNNLLINHLSQLVCHQMFTTKLNKQKLSLIGENYFNNSNFNNSGRKTFLD